MKKFVLLVGLFCGSVLADGTAGVNGLDQRLEEQVTMVQHSRAKESPAKIVAKCDTVNGKQLQISLDEQRTTLMVNYSTVLTDPDQLWVAKTNDMFYSTDYDAAKQSSNKTLYAQFDTDWVTFSVTNLSNNVIITFKVEDKDKHILIDDSCKSIAKLSLGDEVVKDMTWVSNSDEE